MGVLRLAVASNADVPSVHQAEVDGTPVYFPVPKDSTPGDPVLIFTPGHLLARAQITSDPDPDQSFRDRRVFRAQVGNIDVLKPPLRLADVQRAMPASWVWATHPKRSYCTPGEDHAERLAEIAKCGVTGQAIPTGGSAPAEEESDGSGTAPPAPPQAHSDAEATADEAPVPSSAATSPPEGVAYERDPAVRKAVEDHAMRIAEAHYRNLRFDVKVTATTRPYDLRCTKGELEVRVEVKGTQGAGGEVEVTIGEVLNARGTDWRTDLFIVRNIVVSRGGPTPTASEGNVTVIEGWSPADADLLPLRFRCTVRAPAPTATGPERPTDPNCREVFTVGQKSLATPDVLKEIIHTLGIAFVIDIRSAPPSRGAWSGKALSGQLDVPIVAVAPEGDVSGEITSRKGPCLVLEVEKAAEADAGRMALGDAHPDWAIVHIHHPRSRHPISEAECITHEELSAAIRDRPNNEYFFWPLAAYEPQADDAPTDRPEQDDGPSAARSAPPSIHSGGSPTP